jgi:hypothetical protein
MLMTFDGSNRSVCIEKRSRTNTPLQALATLNDPGFIQCSVALGRRLWEQKSGPPAQRARHGLRLALLREPAAEEVNRLVALYQENLLTYEQDPEAARKWIRAGAAKPPSDPVALVELAAWSVVGNVLLNLDETISRY